MATFNFAVKSGGKIIPPNTEIETNEVKAETTVEATAETEAAEKPKRSRKKKAETTAETE